MTDCPDDIRRRARHTPKRKTDRWADFNAFIDATMANLNPRQLRVWLCLFRDAGKDGVCRTAQSYIAKRTGRRRPTVSSIIAALEATGLVVTTAVANAVDDYPFLPFSDFKPLKTIATESTI